MKKAKGGESIMTCKGSGKKTKVFYKKAKKGEPISTILPDAEYVKFVFTPDLDKDRYQGIIKKLEDAARRKTEEILAYHEKWESVCVEFAYSKAREKWFDDLVEYKVKGKFPNLKAYVEHLEQKIEKLESLDKLYPFCQHKVISSSMSEGKLANLNCVECGKDFMPNVKRTLSKNYTAVTVKKG